MLAVCAIIVLALLVILVSNRLRAKIISETLNYADFSGDRRMELVEWNTKPRLGLHARAYVESRLDAAGMCAGK